MTSSDLDNFLGLLLWYKHLIPVICSHIKFVEITKNLYTVWEMRCIGELLEINFWEQFGMGSPDSYAVINFLLYNYFHISVGE